MTLGRLPEGLLQEIFDLLIVQMSECLEMIVAQEGSGMMAESRGIFFDFDEKREDDKATLKTVQVAYSAIPRLLYHNQTEQSALSMLQMLTQVSEDKFVRTNWMVRQAILVCFKSLLEQKRSGPRGKITLEFGATLVEKAAEFGEKYDQNLVYLSSICLLVAEQAANNAGSESGLSQGQHSAFREAAEKLIALL